MHIYVLGPKRLRWNFFKPLRYLYEVRRTNFSSDFWTFRNFWPQLLENCGAAYQRNENYALLLKEQSLLKKSWKPRWNRAINGNAMPVWSMTPLTNSAPDSERYHKNKHHIFASTAGASCTIFPQLYKFIELIETIKKVHFFIQRIVFATGCTEKFGVIDRRAVSQQ